MAEIQTLDEALAYLSPHPSTKGPVILTPEKMREAVGVIQSSLAAERERCAAGEVHFGGGGLKGIRGSRADIDLVQHWQNEAHRAEYLAERLKLYLTEAQRLALLVRRLGGDPEPPPAAIRNLPPQTEGGQS